MAGLRFIQIDFVDGTNVRYSYPVQAANTAAKQVKIESLFKDRFLILHGEGKLTFYPIENIKSVQLSSDEQDLEGVRLPAHAVKGARLL